MTCPRRRSRPASPGNWLWVWTGWHRWEKRPRRIGSQRKKQKEEHLLKNQRRKERLLAKESKSTKKKRKRKQAGHKRHCIGQEEKETMEWWGKGMRPQWTSNRLEAWGTHTYRSASFRRCRLWGKERGPPGKSSPRRTRRQFWWQSPTAPKAASLMRTWCLNGRRGWRSCGTLQRSRAWTSSPTTSTTHRSTRRWRGWQRKSGDPEKWVPYWLEVGAPLGIERNIQTAGIFPVLEAEEERHQGEWDSDELLDKGEMKNYKSVEEDREQAEIELERYMARKFCLAIPRAEAQEKYQGGTVSKMGLILKTKENGEIKRRLVLDICGAAEATPNPSCQSG